MRKLNEVVNDRTKCCLHIYVVLTTDNVENAFN